MRHTTLASIILAVVALTSASASAQGSGERADRVTFNRLIQQIQRTDVDYAKAMQVGMEEARQADGSPSATTQADLLSLRDQRDRLMNRLVLISVRHGWDIPDFNTPAVQQHMTIVTEKDRIFAPAQDAIKSRFKQEAIEIASKLTLPVISVRALED